MTAGPPAPSSAWCGRWCRRQHAAWSFAAAGAPAAHQHRQAHPDPLKRLPQDCHPPHATAGQFACTASSNSLHGRALAAAARVWMLGPTTHLLCILLHPVTDGHNHDLAGRQPQGPLATIVLSQDGQHALNTAQHSPASSRGGKAVSNTGSTGGRLKTDAR